MYYVKKSKDRATLDISGMAYNPYITGRCQWYQLPQSVYIYIYTHRAYTKLKYSFMNITINDNYNYNYYITIYILQL